MSGSGLELEEELKQAREQGQLQAARSEVTTLLECVERQRQQLEALQKALDAARVVCCLLFEGSFEALGRC